VPAHRPVTIFWDSSWELGVGRWFEPSFEHGGRSCDASVAESTGDGPSPDCASDAPSPDPLGKLHDRFSYSRDDGVAHTFCDEASQLRIHRPATGWFLLTRRVLPWPGSQTNWNSGRPATGSSSFAAAKNA